MSNTRLPDFSVYTFNDPGPLKASSKFALKVVITDLGTVAGTLQGPVGVFMSADHNPPNTNCTNRAGAGWVTVPVQAPIVAEAPYTLTIKGLVVPIGTVGTVFAHMFVDSKCEVKELSPDDAYTYSFGVAC